MVELSYTAIYLIDFPRDNVGYRGDEITDVLSCMHSPHPRNRVSLYNSSGCPGTQSIDHTGLKLKEINLALPKESWG